MSYPTFTAELSSIETLYATPGPHPNGLQATAEGLWCLDQHTNRLQLVDYATGDVLVDLATDADRGSGVAYDGEDIWLASTYNRKILRIDRNGGSTVTQYDSPDPSKTGAHGLEWRAGRLWVANPPSATIYQLDPFNNLAVLKSFPAPGKRPHGLGWHGEELWCVETNLRSIFCYDYETGEIRAQLQLPAEAPEPHGMTIWQDHFWYCDAETHLVCRLPVPSLS